MAPTWSLLALAAAVAVAVTRAQTRPDFCQRLECPLFTSQQFSGYELRTYEPTTWVGTSVTSTSTRLNRRDRVSMFRKLFRYIKGENDAGAQIKMTVPVLTRFERAPSGEYTASMLFSLPSAFTANPPAPTEAGVFLLSRPAQDVFVKAFPMRRRAVDADYNTQLSSLLAAISADNPAQTVVDDSVHYRAGYHAPWYRGERQHEVWVDKTA